VCCVLSIVCACLCVCCVLCVYAVCCVRATVGGGISAVFGAARCSSNAERNEEGNWQDCMSCTQLFPRAFALSFTFKNASKHSELLQNNGRVPYPARSLHSGLCRLLKPSDLSKHPTHPNTLIFFRKTDVLHVPHAVLPMGLCRHRHHHPRRLCG